MPEHLAADSLTPLDAGEQDSLRRLNRSPHPYHHQSVEIPERILHRNGELISPPAAEELLRSPRSNSFSKESSPCSESGTEADDEHFLKGLPAPKTKLHKGLRGRDEAVSGSNTPLQSPAIWEGGSDYTAKQPTVPELSVKTKAKKALRQNRILARRATEVCIVVSLGLMVGANAQVAPLFSVWKRDYKLLALLYGSLVACYPLRVIAWAYRHGNPTRIIPLRTPSDFDPAPLLYPPAITTWVSLLVATDNPAVILPNIILSISSFPQQVVPKCELHASYDTFHWFLSCLPLVWSSSRGQSLVSGEDLVLLYPLHQTLSVVLHCLTTTSLLKSELQLFSISLLNVLLLAVSPQAQILKAVLWVGGMGLLISCGSVIRSGIALARVPKWRFRRVTSPKKHSILKDLAKVVSWHKIKNEVLGSNPEGPLFDSDSSLEAEADAQSFQGPKRVQTLGPQLDNASWDGGKTSPGKKLTFASEHQDFEPGSVVRRHTLSYTNRSLVKDSMQTPSGRRKRATSLSIRPFLKLTYGQAQVRKWLYAAYVYAAMLVVILAGIRPYIQKFALHGREPFGWALGYLFGDLPWFRLQVMLMNLDSWICLPPRSSNTPEKQCHLGWVQQIRHDELGDANTRLLISGYWICVFTIGLVTVFKLSEIYEVDTRRKVFHFMMVGMLLPATYVDPTFAALCLSIMLGIFLALDLLRASQLPPLSKPIAYFLAPYVDGRDFRGPVVISHIFLLIGCAIPLWLALAALPRTGSDCLAGWEVPARDVSMVAGVICVGLGDAAASLIGRRYGHRKWLWGGGKSIEGSVAFAVAVFLGLMTASVWLRLGKWPVSGESAGILVSARNAAACGSIASVTEAVLTGGNDNVIVPVVLWTCVKSLRI